MSLLIFGSVLISSPWYMVSSAMVHTFNKVHSECRHHQVPYPKSQNVLRAQVPEDKVSWAVDFPEYKPVEFTHPCIQGQVWADEDITPQNRSDFQWNIVDKLLVNRVSHNGVYSVDVETGKPKNPFGRTGMTGRGLLGRWGPNHAADPLVTRWQRSDNTVRVDPATSKPRLEFLAIRRRVGGAWALPGGMVDKGEQALDTAQREFAEEALNSLAWTSPEQSAQKTLVGELFAKSQPVYHGYVDDARNTDNAWIETVAFHTHDANGDLVDKLQLVAGDDAVDVRWLSVERGTQLFANHSDLIRIVAEKMKAHW